MSTTQSPPPFSIPIPDHQGIEEASSTMSDLISLSSQPSLPSLSSLLYPGHHPPPSPPPSFLQCLATLKAHTSYVTALAVHGSSLLSASSDQDIRLWPSIVSAFSSSAAAAAATSFVVAAAKSPVKSLIVSDHHGLLFSSHQDGKIRAWRVGHEEGRRWKLTAVLPTARDRLLSLLLSPISGNYVRIRRHKKRTWVHHVDAVSGLALSGDASLLYSVSWDRALKVWRASDFQCAESLADAHLDAINAVAASADGYVYTGGADGRINVWKRHGGAEKHVLVQTLEEHGSAVNALALSADGSVLYSGACDREIVAWHRCGDGLMEAVGELRGHTKSVLCLAVVGGEGVCSGSADRTVRVWRRGGGDDRYACVAVLEGHGGPVKSLAVVEESCGERSSSSEEEEESSYLIFTGDLNCDIKVWRLSQPIPT